MPFPYVERDEERVRPAVVVSNAGLGKDGTLFWALMITSEKGRDAWPGDIPVGEEHTAYGLPVPCLIRTAKLSTLSFDAIERRLGSLPETLMTKVRQSLIARLHH